MALPSNISYGRVTGRYLLAVGDSNDPDNLPDSQPAEGTVTFTPSVPRVLNVSTDPPVTITPKPIVATLDDNGYVGSPSGVWLVATDDPDLNPTGWTYSVTVALSGIAKQTYSIAVTSDSDNDLSVIAPVPSGAGAAIVVGPEGPPGPPGEGADLTGYATETYVDQAVVDAGGGSGLADGLVAPVYIAHRGGHLRYPEHSMEGYDACAFAGFAIEPDVQPLADGTLVCIHDDTVNAQMVRTDGTAIPAGKRVDTITAAQWKRDYRIAPQVTGAAHAVPVTFEEVLDRHGSSALIVVEPKDPAVGDSIIALVAAKGLQRSVIVQSFTLSVCETVAAAGLPAMLLRNATGPTAASLLASGIEYIGVGPNAVPAEVTAYLASDLRVFHWTINSRTQWDAQRAAGAFGVFSDDPWWLDGRLYRQVTDPYAERVPWPHFAAQDMSESGFRRLGELIVTKGTNVNSTAQEWAFPSPTGRVRVTFTLRMGPVSTNVSRWAAIAYGMMRPEEASYLDVASTAGQSAINVLIRRSGDLVIFSNDDRGSVQRGITTGAEFAPPSGIGEGRFQFDVTDTAVTLTNLTTGASVTWADSDTTRYRQPGARFSFVGNRSESYVRDVLVEYL